MRTPNGAGSWLSATAGAVRRQARPVGQSLLMPAVASRGLGFSRRPGSRLLVVAQTLSWGGDVALTRTSRASFLAGVGSFLAAQVAYVAAYRTRSSTPVLGTPARRRAMVAGIGGALGMAVVARRADPVLALPVAAYGVTLVTMVVSAAAVDEDRGRGQLLLGGSLFLVSDLLIGVRMFMTDGRAAAVGTAVAATYTAGQCCISDAMLRS